MNVTVEDESAQDWRRTLKGWADFAVARARQLNDLEEGRHALLHSMACQLRAAIDAPDCSPYAQDSRRPIAMLAGYLRCAGASLRDSVIPLWEAQAYAAATDIETAGLQVLVRMDGDFGPPVLLHCQGPLTGELVG
jgi:hypothetical protein